MMLRSGLPGFVMVTTPPLTTHQPMKHIDHIIQPRRVEAGVDADPKHLIHNEIRILQIADYAMLDARISWLPQQVAAEEEPRLNAIALQHLHNAVPRQLHSR